MSPVRWPGSGRGQPSKRRSPGPPDHTPSQAPSLLLTLHRVGQMWEFPTRQQVQRLGECASREPVFSLKCALPRHCQAAPHVTVTQRSRGHLCPVVGQAREHKAGVPGTSRATEFLTCASFQEFSKTGRSGRKLTAWPLQATPGHRGVTGATSGRAPALEGRCAGAGGGRCPPHAWRLQSRTEWGEVVLLGTGAPWRQLPALHPTLHPDAASPDSPSGQRWGLQQDVKPRACTWTVGA